MSDDEVHNIIIICSVALLFLLSGTGICDTFRVTPEKSIQAAIDGSRPGDVIEVTSGIYYENVAVTKPLEIIGLNTGSGYPIVDAKGRGSAIVIESDGVLVDHLNFRGAGGWEEAGVLIKANGCKLINCTSGENRGIGIYLFHADDNILVNNYVFESDFGVALNHSSNNTLRDNLMHENRNNFLAGYGENEIDTSNMISERPLYYLVNKSDIVLDSSSNAGDVYCIGCRNITIRDLSIENNFVGIYLQNTSDCRIINNTLCNNTMGISLIDSSDNFIEDNILMHDIYGIHIKSDLTVSSNNTVTRNNASDNNYGIFLNIDRNGGEVGPKNLVFANVLLDNKQGNAYSRGDANWDDGNSGNRYGDFDDPSEGCIDSNGDGICDRAYRIRGGRATDRYPLSAPSALSSPSAPSPAGASVN